jgi:hypothetical protein
MRTIYMQPLEGIEALPVDDLFHSVGKLYDSSNIKISFLLFVGYIIINTDIFAERALNKIVPGSYDMSNDKFTSTGILVAGMALSLFYLLVDLLTKSNIL